MTDIEHLRHSILSEAETMRTKRRFGLFSHPISTAIGDDSPFRSKERIIIHMQIHEINWESQLLNLEISTCHLLSRAG